MEGVIKNLVRDRGFGFIRDDSGGEWFFHRTEVLPHKQAFANLTEQDRVRFDMGSSPKGPKAINVERL
jgi:cold shock protein